MWVFEEGFVFVVLESLINKTHTLHYILQHGSTMNNYILEKQCTILLRVKQLKDKKKVKPNNKFCTKPQKPETFEFSYKVIKVSYFIYSISYSMLLSKK